MKLEELIVHQHGLSELAAEYQQEIDNDNTDEQLVERVGNLEAAVEVIGEKIEQLYAEKSGMNMKDEYKCDISIQKTCQISTLVLVINNLLDAGFELNDMKFVDNKERDMIEIYRKKSKVEEVKQNWIAKNRERRKSKNNER